MTAAIVFWELPNNQTIPEGGAAFYEKEATGEVQKNRPDWGVEDREDWIEHPAASFKVRTKQDLRDTFGIKHVVIPGYNNQTHKPSGTFQPDVDVDYTVTREHVLTEIATQAEADAASLYDAKVAASKDMDQQAIDYMNTKMAPLNLTLLNSVNGWDNLGTPQPANGIQTVLDWCHQEVMPYIWQKKKDVADAGSQAAIGAIQETVDFAAQPFDGTFPMGLGQLWTLYPLA